MAMKFIRTNTIEVCADEELDFVSLRKAIYNFHYLTPNNPEELILSPHSRANLFTQAESQYLFTMNPETVMGMKITVDPNLKNDEWKIVKKESKTYATEIN